jgi:hydroxymethylbilane synthase
LARTQSATVGKALAAISGREWHEVIIRTAGDDTTKSLNQPGVPGLFVSTLRQALLNGDVDVIVHSYKDLPSAPEPGITLAAVPMREDARDALVSRDGLSLAQLPHAAVIGSSSPRRAAALLSSRPDLVIVPIRGNVDTRIQKVRDGEVDATVLALAGLRRIGREHEASEILDAAQILAAPAQGALAVECRSDDHVLLELLAQLEDPVSRLTTSAEREVLVGINAACTTAVAAAATFDGTHLTLDAKYWEDGQVESATHIQMPLEVGNIRGARAIGLLAAARLLHGAGPSVLLVRSEGTETEADELGINGFTVLSEPYVQITPDTGDQPLALLDQLGELADGKRWLVVTSPMTLPSWESAVGREPLLAAMRQAIESGWRAAAVGARSAATLEEMGWPEVATPPGSSAADLVELLAAEAAGLALFPRSAKALRTLPDGLRELGWQVNEGAVYDTTTVASPPLTAELVKAGAIDAVVLRSPSAVRALLEFANPSPNVLIVCGGQSTAEAARQLGLKVGAIAAGPSAAEVTQAVVEALSLGENPRS